jgi:hypothetical protein
MKTRPDENTSFLAKPNMPRESSRLLVLVKLYIVYVCMAVKKPLKGRSHFG